ncbi:centromere protein M-like [Xenia sp. Carnegie-2017]|uniref:centromere protein M-like n=1 Tax=Xenia sp. Carnegie-2017 TaxID=2897299 RepID=UPI001F03F5CD|nr:centromere protein M-like [Xenia sp. Carnegie-2017]
MTPVRVNQNNILCRFRDLPTYNHATLLIVSVKGIGSEDLVEAILQMDTSYSVQIRTTTSLPLPQLSKTESRPRIDYIIFALDLSNQHSCQMIEEAVAFVDVDYFIGRSCFILSKANQEHLHSVDVTYITDMIKAYDSTMFFGDLQNKDDRFNMVEKILHHVEVACGFRKGINPLLLSATKHLYSFDDMMTP